MFVYGSRLEVVEDGDHLQGFSHTLDLNIAVPPGAVRIWGLTLVNMNFLSFFHRKGYNSSTKVEVGLR